MFPLPDPSSFDTGPQALRERPIDIRERLPITEDDVGKLLLASREFAEREEMDLDGRRGPRGFAIFLEKRDLNIAAYNMRERDFVDVRAWHYTGFSEAERELVGRYIRLVKEILSGGLEAQSPLPRGEGTGPGAR
jgi:hypothetical protein